MIIDWQYPISWLVIGYYDTFACSPSMTNFGLLNFVAGAQTFSFVSK